MSTKKRAPKKITIDYKNGKIYKIVNDVNDLVYIGSTTTTLSRRFSKHKASKEDNKFHTAMRELGADHFRIILIELYPCGSKSELVAREFAVMSACPKETCYNANYAGVLCDESREKIRQNNAMKGKIERDTHLFKRGSLREYLDRGEAHHNGFQFTWQDAGKPRTKNVIYGKIRTRLEAYMVCFNLRNSIFPLTTRELIEELPFADV